MAKEGRDEGSATIDTTLSLRRSFLSDFIVYLDTFIPRRAFSINQTTRAPSTVHFKSRALARPPKRKKAKNNKRCHKLVTNELFIIFFSNLINCNGETEGPKVDSWIIVKRSLIILTLIQWRCIVNQTFQSRTVDSLDKRQIKN